MLHPIIIAELEPQFLFFAGNMPQPAATRGPTEEKRGDPDAAPAAAFHCEAGGAEPPREAVRIAGNARMARPDLLVHSRHSREPGGATRMLIIEGEVAIALG